MSGRRSTAAAFFLFNRYCFLHAMMYNIKNNRCKAIELNQGKAKR